MINERVVTADKSAAKRARGLLVSESLLKVDFASIRQSSSLFHWRSESYRLKVKMLFSNFNLNL